MASGTNRTRAETQADTERVDILLALALAFADLHNRKDAENGDAAATGERVARDEGTGSVEDHIGHDEPKMKRTLALLSELSVSDRAAIEKRAAWHAALPANRQAQWLAHTLGRTRSGQGQLDAHVHPTHIVEVLRDEPARIRQLVVAHLPREIAAPVAVALGIEASHTAHDADRFASAIPVASDAARHAAIDAEHALPTVEENDNAAARRQPHHAPVPNAPYHAPVPSAMSVVRKAFLASFVGRAELPKPSPLDALSSSELARLVRLLGIRETALACRGITAVETVAAFLRRFAPEDARAIATQIATLTTVEPERVELAGACVQRMIALETEPGAMLDRIGIELLATTLSVSRERRLAYAAQKLPVELARELRRLAQDIKQTMPIETARMLCRETEVLAAEMRRVSGARRPVKSSHSAAG